MTKAACGILAPACKGDLIDAAHPAALEYLARHPLEDSVLDPDTVSLPWLARHLGRVPTPDELAERVLRGCVSKNGALQPTAGALQRLKFEGVLVVIGRTGAVLECRRVDPGSGGIEQLETSVDDLPDGWLTPACVADRDGAEDLMDLDHPNVRELLSAAHGRLLTDEEISAMFAASDKEGAERTARKPRETRANRMRNADPNMVLVSLDDLRSLIEEAVSTALVNVRQHPPELIGAEEIGKRVGVCARTVRHWVSEGCPHVRAGRKLRFREPDVLRWLEERES